MNTKSFNIQNCLETKGASVTLVTNPTDEDFSESTGNRTVSVYNGPYAALVAKAQELYKSGASATAKITYEVTQTESFMGELRITTESFRKPDDDESSDNNNDDAGDPTYTMSAKETDEDILAHPKFQSLSTDELRALRALMNGMDDKDTLKDGNGKSLREIGNMLKSDAAKQAARLIRAGARKYKGFTATVTAEWNGMGSHGYRIGKICTPPGGIASVLGSAKDGRNWLCVGLGAEKKGDSKKMTATFMLSGPGGWPTYLYGK